MWEINNGARWALNDRFSVTIRVREIESAIVWIYLYEAIDARRRPFFHAINDRGR